MVKGLLTYFGQVLQLSFSDPLESNKTQHYQGFNPPKATKIWRNGLKNMTKNQKYKKY